MESSSDPAASLADPPVPDATSPVTSRRTRGDADLSAPDLGTKLRAARQAAGLTQDQLAGGRYTKAYVSALENGLGRPSMAALSFFASQLGVPPSRFLDGETPRWRRLEADIRLASGDWHSAAEAYDALLAEGGDERTRADLLLGKVEAFCRLDRGADAIAPAAEAVETFTRLGDRPQAARATYWLAGAHYQHENTWEAQALLQDVLQHLRAGLEVEPGFKLRVLLALGGVATHEGEHQRAQAYLEEARGLAGDLDGRRQATFLYSLASSYRETGDLELAIHLGSQSLALFRSAGGEFETAAMENDLGLTYLALGDPDRARELVESARARSVALGDDRLLAHISDTEAQIALATGSRNEAVRLAANSLRLAQATGNHKAAISALRTGAKAQLAAGHLDGASATLRRAADLARKHGKGATLREVLKEAASTAAQLGRHEQAYQLAREALSLS